MAVTGITVTGIVDSNGNVVDSTDPFEYVSGSTVEFQAEVTVDSTGTYTFGGAVQDRVLANTDIFIRSSQQTVNVPFNSPSVPEESFANSGVVNSASGIGDLGNSVNVVSGTSGTTLSLSAGSDTDAVSFAVSKQSQTPDIGSLSSLNIDGQGSSATITENNDVPIAFDVDANTADTYSFSAETGGGTSIGSTSASLATGLQTVTIGSGESNTSALSPATFTVTVSDSGNTASVTSTDGLTVQSATGPVAGEWTIAGERLDYVSERRTAREIEWGFRVGQTELVALQPLLDAAGKVSLVERIDGGFEAVDRANGDATFAGLAPTKRASVRPVDTWLIREYDVEYLSSDGQEQFVTIVAAPIREKTGASSNPFSTIGTPTRLTNDPNQWFFEFEYGDILTSQVTSNLTSANDAQVQVYSIELIVSPVEARRIEESCGKSGAVTVREIVDGANFPVVDTTGANRVTITPPTSAQDDVAVGEYGVLAWETSFNRNVYRVNMEVVKL